jgi:hypothetical protein
VGCRVGVSCSAGGWEGWEETRRKLPLEVEMGGVGMEVKGFFPGWVIVGRGRFEGLDDILESGKKRSSLGWVLVIGTGEKGETYGATDRIWTANRSFDAC